MGKKVYTGNAFLDKLSAGPYVKNPNYNPKTKAGRTQPSVLLNTTPGDIYGGSLTNANDIRGRLKFSNTDLGLTAKEFEDSIKNGFTPSPYNSQKEMDTAYAKNQSAFEQFGNFLMQAGVGEMILGTLEGFGNIADGIINTFTGDNYNRNPYTKFMADAKENLKKKFEIHQENPGATFQFGDFGWWMNGLVNTATTVSLMLPAAGWAKGISTLGKISGVNKAGRMVTRGVSRGIAKATTRNAKNLNKFDAINATGGLRDLNTLRTVASKAGKIEKGMLYGSAAISQAALSRAGESFLEAKEVFSDIETKTTENLQAMIDADAKNGTNEFAKFIENNPQFKHPDGTIMSVDEIAKEIARQSANKTFYNDWWMLANDIVQYLALGSVWGKHARRTPKARERIAAKNQQRILGGAKPEELIKDNFLNRAKENLKFAVKNPLESPLQTIVTEGFEEVYQGIQIEKGKEVYDKYFDKNFTPRTLSSYLTDWSIWEQGFWGALGGVAFNYAHSKLGDVKKAVQSIKNKKTMTAEDYERWKRSDDKIAIEQINNTTNRIREFIANMEMIERGENPYKAKVDESNGRRIIKDGELLFENIATETEKDALKQRAIQEFIDNTTVDAVDYGIYDLMKEIIGSNEFDKFIADNGLQRTEADAALSQQIVKRMEEVSGIYESALTDVNAIVDDPNPYITIAAARNITRTKLAINDIDYKIGLADIDLANENVNGANYDKYINKQLYDTFNKYLLSIQTDIKNLDEAYYDGKISLAAYRTNKEELIALANNLLIYIKNNTEQGALDEIKEKLNAYIKDEDIDNVFAVWNSFAADYSRKVNAKDKPSETISNIIKDKIKLQLQKVYLESKIPSNRKEYQNIYDAFSMSMDAMTIKRINSYIDDVKKYLRNSEDLEIAINKVLTERTEDKKLNEALKFLKYGYYSLSEDKVKDKGQVFIDAQIEAVIEGVRKEREEAQQDIKEGEEFGTPLPEETGEDTKQDTSDEEVTDDSPSTGNGTEPVLIVNDNDEQTGNAVTDNGQSPVEGTDEAAGQITADEDIIIDNDIPVYEEKDVEFTEQQLKEQAAIAEQDKAGVNKVDIDSIAYITKAFYSEQGRIDNITKDLLNNDTKSYDKFIQELVDFLVTRGYDKRVAEVSAKNQFANIVASFATNDNKSLFNKLAKQLAIGFGENGAKKYSVTELLDGAGLNETVKEFVDEYARIVELEQLEDGRYVVNMQSLFDYLLNNENIDIRTASYIYNNINDFIARNDESKYIFTGFYESNNLTATEFFNRLREQKARVIQSMDEVHISPIEPEHRGKQYTKALELVGSGKAKAYVKQQRDSYGYVSNLSVYVDIVEKGKRVPVKVGILRTVETNNDLSSIHTLSHYSGFANTINVNPNGNVSLDCDKLFYALIERKAEDVEARQLYNILVNYYITVTDIRKRLSEGKIKEVEANKELAAAMPEDTAKKLLNNSYIKDILNTGVYKIYDVHNKKDVEKARIIAKSISRILFYDQHFDETDPTNKATNNMALDKRTMRNSYEQWKQKVYVNYVNTYELQKQLNNDDAQVDINLNVPYYTVLNTVPSPDKNINIANAGFDINPDSDTYTPFVIVNKQGYYIGEDGTNYGMAVIGVDHRSIGFLVSNDRGMPLTALGVKAQDISQKEIAKAIKQELKNIFVKQFNNTINDNHESTFEDIRDRIEELFGVGALFNFNKVPGKLGVIVRRPSSGRFITIQALVNNEYIDAITFFSKNKDGSNGHSIGIYNFDKGKQDYYDNIKDIEKRINDFIDFLTTRVEINRTESVVTNKTSTGNTPKFFSRKDGKFIIHLGGQDFVYKNYGDFIIQNEGFTTNVDGSKGSFTIGYLNEDSLTIDAVVRDSSEVKQVNNTDVSDLLFADLSDNRKTVKTEDVLRAAGVDDDTIKVLRGKSIGKTLVVDTVRPVKEDRDDAYAYFNKEDKNIYITPKGAAAMNGNPRNAVRLILHENIHRLFNDDSNLTDAQRQRIIRELKEVYNYTLTQLEKDKDSGKIDYKTYTAIINVFNKATSNNNDNLNMEEFLMECLTQKVIADYLNNTEYHSEVNIDGIPKAKKSIFQKLMDILLNLLGINNQRIKNNSILAREYMILSRTSNATDAGLFNKPTNEITTDITPIKPIEPIIDDSKLPGEDLIDIEDYYISDDTDTIFDDDIESFARTELIEETTAAEIYATPIANGATDNAFGVRVVNNLSEFINSFPVQYRDSIQQILAENELNFTCQ